MTLTSNPALGAPASAFPGVVGAAVLTGGAVITSAGAGAGTAGVAEVAGVAAGGGDVEGPHAADRQIKINAARLMRRTVYPMALVPVNMTCSG
jgi:hypothetical protein